MSIQHDIKTVQLFLGQIGNASLRGQNRRDLFLKARAAFDRLTLGNEDAKPAAFRVVELIPLGEIVHVGRGSMEEVTHAS